MMKSEKKMKNGELFMWADNSKSEIKASKYLSVVCCVY